MRLLEIVRGEKTSPETIVTGLDVSRTAQGRVVVGDASLRRQPMMLDGYFRETDRLLLEGASTEQIDRVAEAFGFAMGPNKVNEMAVSTSATDARGAAQAREPPDPYHVVSDALTPLGRIGQKSARASTATSPRPHAEARPRADPDRGALAAERGIHRRAFDDNEIEERLTLR